MKTYPASRIAAPCLACAIGLFAADPTEVWTSADLKASAERLAPEAQTKSIAGKTLGTWGNHNASLWRRAQSGEAELHKTKTDLLVIEDGSATLVTGGSIPDAHPTALNEVRGSSIRGGISRKIGPGDIIRIPPGTPHRFILDKGQSVSYFALKLGPQI
jgi:mannose-6-phosphate isomerase-like protein (cupin superfamily)